MRGEAVDESGQGLAAGGRGQDQPGAAQGTQHLSGVFGGTVDVVVRAEVEGGLPLVLAASDGDRLQAHGPLCRSALNVVTPAQPKGAASSKESPSGMRMRAAAGTVMVVAQPPG